MTSFFVEHEKIFNSLNYSLIYRQQLTPERKKKQKQG